MAHKIQRIQIQTISQWFCSCSLPSGAAQGTEFQCHRCPQLSLVECRLEDEKSGRKIKVLNWSTSAWGRLLSLENAVKPSLSGFNSQMKSLLDCCVVRLSRFLKKSIEWWSVLYMEEKIKPGVNPQTFGKFLTNLSTCDILTWYRKKAMKVCTEPMECLQSIIIIQMT